MVSGANRLLLLNGRRIHDEALIGFVSRACRQVHTKRRKAPEPTFVLDITAPKETFEVRCVQRHTPHADLSSSWALPRPRCAGATVAVLRRSAIASGRPLLVKGKW